MRKANSARTCMHEACDAQTYQRLLLRGIKATMPIRDRSLGEAAENEDSDDDSLPELPPKMVGGARIRARMAAVQAIYQWRMSEPSIGDVIEQFAQSGRLADMDRAYFEMLLRGVAHDVSELERAFDAHLSRPAAQLDPVEHAILLLATFELRECLEIPFAVVINEATNLARVFGATDGHRFINGVLDATARDLRPVEAARNSAR